MNDVSSPGVVLHVEDNADERESLAAVLETAGFRIHAADSAGAAIEVAGKLRDDLDVLIVDYHLGSRETGTEVAESVARVLGRSVPTVILTGDPANAEFPLLTNAPIWLVRKPAPPEVLTSALPSLVAFHRALRGFGKLGRR